MASEQEITAAFDKLLSEKLPPPKTELGERDYPELVHGVISEDYRLGGQTAFGRITDLLSMGEYWSAGLTADYILGRKMSPERIAAGFVDPRADYQKISRLIHPEWSSWKQKGMGLVYSIILDPSTYTPAGTLTVPFKAIKGTKIGKKALKALKEGELGKTFVPGAGLPEDYYEFKYYTGKVAQARQKDILSDIEDLARGLSKEDRELLTYYREHPDAVSQLPRRLRDKLEAGGKMFDDLADDAYEKGLLTDAEYEQWVGRKGKYVPHVYPYRIREGGKAKLPEMLASGAIPPALTDRLRRPGWMKERTFETLDDVDRLARQFKDVSEAKSMDDVARYIDDYDLKDAFGKMDFSNLAEVKSYAKAQAKFYEPEKDFVRLIAYRRLDQESYTAQHKFVENVIQMWGRKVAHDLPVAPEGFKKYFPKGYLRFFMAEGVDKKTVERLMKDHGEMIPYEALEEAFRKTPGITKKVPVYLLPEAIARDMDAPARFFSSTDPITNKWVRRFDKMTNAWKAMATSIRVPFHLRNWYSNVFQCYLAGMKNPHRFVQAAQLQAGKLKSIKLGNETYTLKEIKTLVDRLGVHGRGWVGSDIQRNIANEIESVLTYGRARKLNPFHWGRAAGSTIEDNSRIALFLDSLAKGEGPLQASKRVRKFLFDYSELTDTERKLKRFIPFYTWTRKNFVLQMENIIAQPRKYQAWVKGLRAFQDTETKEELQFKPEYFNELLYVKSPWKTDDGKTIYMSIDLPPLELGRIANTRQWLGSLHPAKLVFELILNKSMFTGRKLKRRPLDYAPAPFWITYLPQPVLNAMKRVKAVDFIRMRETGEMRLGVDKKVLHTMHSMFPFLNEMSRVYAQPVSLSDERPEMKKRAYMTGLGWKALDLDMSKKFHMYKTAASLQKDIQGFMRQTGRAPQGDEWDVLMGR